MFYLPRVPLFIPLALVLLYSCSICNGISFDEFTKLTRSELQKFEQFKAKVLPLAYTDWMKEEIYLIKFLKVQDFNIDKAVAAFKDVQYVKWRKDNKMDTIHSEDWSEFERDYPITLSGFDREGRPILLYTLAEMNIRKAAVSGKLKQLVRYTIKRFDEIEIKIRQQQKLKKNVAQGVILADLNGVNAVQHVNFVSMPYYVDVVLNMISKFPLLSDKIILINSPQIFQVVLNVALPLMDPYTRDSVKVHGKNRNVWEPIIRQIVDPSQVPERYGGNPE